MVVRVKPGPKSGRKIKPGDWGDLSNVLTQPELKAALRFRGWWKHWQNGRYLHPVLPLAGFPPRFPGIGEASPEWWICGNCAWQLQGGTITAGYIWRCETVRD